MDRKLPSISSFGKSCLQNTRESGGEIRPTKIPQGGHFPLDLLQVRCLEKKSKNIIPKGRWLHGDESHGIESLKHHLKNKSKFPYDFQQPQASQGETDRHRVRKKKTSLRRKGRLSASRSESFCDMLRRMSCQIKKKTATNRYLHPGNLI